MNLLPGLGTKLAAVVSAAVLMGTVAAPAYALRDTMVEHSTVSKDWRNSTVQVAEQQSADSMPDNPNAKLPDSVSEKISGDAMVVSEDLAVTPQGEVKDVQSGKTVKDKDLVGTQSQQPDPLAKTDGESFIPVSAQDVKEAVDQNKASQADNAQEQDSQSDDSRTDDATESEGTVKQSVEHTGSSAKNSAKVRTAGFGSNEYGAHWSTYDGNKAFFDYQNNLFAQQAKGVIDVSSWQGDINWAAAKADGVEGAIIRLGYGWGNAADSKAKRNISECKRLGIPFGIYWYSYAYDANTARQEGQDVAAKLRQLGVSQNDLAYPVFYDLERWTWTGHRPPTDPNVYSAMVNSWYSAMQSGGYTNLGVYSYTSYLQGPLNNANVYSKTRWVAQYGAKMGYTAFGTNDRGWQYTSSGHVNGISGNVDMNAFGNKDKTYVSTGKWVQKDGHQYWQEADGTYAHEKEIYDPSTNAWYWVDADGTMAHDKDVYLRSNGGKWVRYDSNGHMVKGEDCRYGAWYYFDTTTGAMAKGMKHISSNGGKWVYYDWTTGKMAYGERYVNYDDQHTGWYLFDQHTGAMFHGDTYIRSSGGKWVRYDRVTGKVGKGPH